MGLGSSFQMPGMLSAEWLSLAAGGGLAAHKALILANAHSSILSAEHLKLHTNSILQIQHRLIIMRETLYWSTFHIRQAKSCSAYCK